MRKSTDFRKDAWRLADGAQSNFQYIGNIDKAENDCQKVVYQSTEARNSEGDRRPAYRDDMTAACASHHVQPGQIKRWRRALDQITAARSGAKGLAPGGIRF